MTRSPNISLTPTHQNLIQAVSGLICVIQFVFPDMLSPLCSESWWDETERLETGSQQDQSDPVSVRDRISENMEICEDEVCFFFAG